MNPRNKPFEHGRTKKIHETNLFNTRGIPESESKGFGQIWLVYSTKDLWWFIGIVESFENCDTNQFHEMNLLSTVGQNKSTKQIFWTP
jgi:hypothetical protein